MTGARDEAEAFARAAAAVTSTVAQVLAQFDSVLAAQRHGIVALAAAGGVDMPAIAPSVIAVPAPADMSESSPSQDAAHDPTGLARAALYQVATQAIALALFNAVTAQQHLNLLGQAVATQAAARVLAGRGE